MSTLDYESAASIEGKLKPLVGLEITLAEQFARNSQKMGTVSRLGLRVVLKGRQDHRSYLEIEAWMPSEVEAISPLADWAIRLIEESQCVVGHEKAVELALREALSNAVVHGNQLDSEKLVHVQCQCEWEKGASVIVTDSGQGFDPNGVSDPLATERLEAEHGRGIHLMKLAMDEVTFARGGTEVRMWKGPGK